MPKLEAVGGWEDNRIYMFSLCIWPYGMQPVNLTKWGRV